MKEEFKYNGYWWLPESPKEQFAGELIINEQGTIVLTILDSRQPSDNLRSKVEDSYKIPIIHGYARNKSTKKDIAFTLYNNSVLSLHISGLAEFSFESQYLTTYKHYENSDSLKIGYAFLEIQLLNEWIEISGIKEVKNKGIRKFKLSFNYEQPKPITLLKNKDLHIYIWFYANNSKKENSFEFNEQARVNIEFNKSVTFQELKRHIETIQSFFTFCISVPTAIQKIEFRELTRKDFKRVKAKYQHDYDLIITDNRVFSDLKSLQGKNMLIEYCQIKNNEARYLAAWLTLNQKFEPVFKLYFDTLYNPGLYKENAFLNNVAALEIYHRIKNPEYDGKNSAYAKKLEEIFKKIKDKNDINWLKVRLDKRKEQSLFNRIMAITERTPHISKRIIKDFKEFATKVSNTRHYLTHFDSKNKEKGIASNEELIELIGKTRLLIQVQILLDLGFTENETNTLIKKAVSNWYKWNQ